MLRPGAANEVWLMDFVFVRIATGRSLKALVIVDDATDEAVAVLAEHSIGGERHTRMMDLVCSRRGRTAVIRTDNGREFAGKAMLNWAYRNVVSLRLIEPGKPNQHAYVGSFNERRRVECPSEHWFTGLPHARLEIERWRREYNEERPKQEQGDLTPTQCAKHLAEEAVTLAGNSNYLLLLKTGRSCALPLFYLEGRTNRSGTVY